MSFNLDNALHGVQEARAAIFLETGNPLTAEDRERELEDI